MLKIFKKLQKKKNFMKLQNFQEKYIFYFLFFYIFGFLRNLFFKKKGEKEVMKNTKN